MIGRRGKCWPAATRSSNWQVQTRGGAGHAASTWRKWMEPVRSHPHALNTTSTQRAASKAEPTCASPGAPRNPSTDNR